MAGAVCAGHAVQPGPIVPLSHFAPLAPPHVHAEHCAAGGAIKSALATSATTGETDGHAGAFAGFPS